MFDFFKKSKAEKLANETPGAGFGNRIMISRHDEIVHSEENIPLLELASRSAGMPIYKGVVKHIYESDFTGYKDKCPRCGGQVVRHFCNFAYATQKKSRLLAAPAGLFCLDCALVIVDDDMMRESIDGSKYEYWGVFSVESGYQEAVLIETINGEKPVFILDENQQEIEGYLQSVHQPKDSVYLDPKNVFGLNSPPSNKVSQALAQPLRQPNIKKKKAKNKTSKQSRKASRKKEGSHATTEYSPTPHACSIPLPLLLFSPLLCLIFIIHHFTIYHFKNHGSNEASPHPQNHRHSRRH
jgi:hypothetical protein